MRKISTVLVSIIITGMLAAPAAATCTPDAGQPYVAPHSTTETAELEPASWQRYSWTGGPHTADTPPAFPGDGWQPNVAGDPHDIGAAGAYYRSNGNSGNGDWFYLEYVPAVVETIVTDYPGQPYVAPTVCEPVWIAPMPGETVAGVEPPVIELAAGPVVPVIAPAAPAHASVAAPSFTG